MTIHLETQVIASRVDETARTCLYTVERNGKRYTATVGMDDLEKLKGNKQARRSLIASALQTAMQGKPDPNPTGRP